MSNEVFQVPSNLPTWSTIAALMNPSDVASLISAWQSGGLGTTAVNPLALRRYMALFPIAATPYGFIVTLRKLWEESAGVTPQPRRTAPRLHTFLPLACWLLVPLVIFFAWAVTLWFPIVEQSGSGVQSEFNVTVNENAVNLRWSAPNGATGTLLVERRLESAADWTQLSKVEYSRGSYTDNIPYSSQILKYFYRVTPPGKPTQSAIYVQVPPKLTPTVAPTATRTATPTPVPTPLAQGSPSFISEVIAASSLLDSTDHNAFERYKKYARTVREIPDASEDFCAYVILPTPTINVYANCVSGVPAGSERTRRLASTLSHESTHLLLEVEGSRSLVVQFDSKWLKDAVADFGERYRRDELGRLRAQLNAQVQRAYSECDQIMSDAEAEIRRNPGASPAAVVRFRAAAAADAQECKNSVDAEASRVLAQNTGLIDASVRRIVERDVIADYVRNLEGERGRTSTVVERADIVASECWAQHEGLVTYAKLGGTQLGELRDVLFLNRPECRQTLNLGF